jgi:hypothetical protein
MHLNELTCFEVMPHPWHTRAWYEWPSR